jgi:hypothetical protein
MHFKKGEMYFFKCDITDFEFPGRFLFVSSNSMARVFVSFKAKKPNADNSDIVTW